MAKIKLIKDVASTNVRIEGISSPPIGLNAFTCGVSAAEGLITIFNPTSPVSSGVPTSRIYKVPYTEFVKSDGSDPVSAVDLKADIDLQLSQEATSEDSGYRGLFNPLTDDLSTLDPAPEVGDFFFVSANGNYNGVDYEINDRIQWDGLVWNRIPRAEPWDYINADDSYDVTVLNNRNYVDYFLTANKDMTLPTLTSADKGWICTIVNSSTSRLRIFGTTSGSRRLNRGGSLMILWNGTGYVVLNYIGSSTILSFSDFANAAVNHLDTIHVDPNTSVNLDDMDGSVLFPYNNLSDAISNSNSGNVISLRGVNEVSSEIVLPHSLIFKGYNDAEIKYSSYNASNGNLLSFDGDNSQEFEFHNIKFSNAGDYALYIRNVDGAVIKDCIFTHNGWNGTSLNTVVDSSTSGILGYDSINTDLQAFYAGPNASNGGAMRIQSSRVVELISNECYENLRGLRLQNCGIGGFGFVSRNQVYNNIESGIYLASSSYDATGGCENFTIYNNASKYNANNGILVIGGANNIVSLNVVEGNWNAGVMGWHVSNTTFRDLDLTNNNRGAYNGIGNNGDAHASVTIGGNTARANRDFIAYVLGTEVKNTGLGSNTSRIGFQILEDVQEITDDYSKTLINIDNVGFKSQDYCIDSLADLDIVKLTIGDCRYIDTVEKNVNTLNGYYYELPFSNHHTNINDLDVSLDNTSSQIILKEGLWGNVLNPYGINTLQAIAFGTKIRIILKGSKKIQLEVEVSDVSVNGSMVNSVLSNALVQLNDIFTNTSGFATNSNPVTAFTLSGNDLTITLQDGISYTVDVTTLGVDENKFVSSGALNGSNLELTMNDSSVITIDASNMINGSSLPAIANNWYIAYGGSAGNEITYPSVVSEIKGKQPFYNGDFLEKGEEYVWTHDDSASYLLGLWNGLEQNYDESEVFNSTRWSANFIFGSTAGKVLDTSIGVDVASRFSGGYSVTNNTVFALRYGNDNYLYLYDISNPDPVLIGKSNIALVGDSQTIFFGGGNQPNAKFPVTIKRTDTWTIVADFDDSEDGEWSDGIEQQTIIKSNLEIESGYKVVWQLPTNGNNRYFGIDYTGPATGESTPVSSLVGRWRWHIRSGNDGIQEFGDYTFNTSNSLYDGSAWENSTGAPITVSYRYNTNNVLEMWDEDSSELIMTYNNVMDGTPFSVHYGANSYASSETILPNLSIQQIGQGSQPITAFAPDISNQSFDITEDTAFNVQIALDAGSDIVNIYVEEDAPSWAVLNQETGEFIGTAPPYLGHSDSYVINCKAANAIGGSVSFQLTLNVQEVVYTNTKSLKFADGINSYLGGNASLVTSLERSGNGSGSSEDWTIGFWWKKTDSGQTGQTLFYFGNNDTVNNGYIEIKQVQNGKIRLRYGSNNNYLQLQTVNSPITTGDWVYIMISYNGGTTGSSSGSLSNYYSRFKIFANGVQENTANSQNNFGWSNSIVGQNFRFGRLVSGNYPKDGLLNQLAIWSSDQSSNAVGLYNNGETQDISLIVAGSGSFNTNYLPASHYYEIESSTSTIQDLVGTAHLVGYNFNSSDLVDDAPPTS